MQLAETMAGGALVVSLISLLFSVQANWPQIKVWLEEVRDTVLWFALLAVLAGAGWFAWSQYERTRLLRGEVPAAQVSNERGSGIVNGE